MSKNIKLSIKNKQLADSLNIGQLKDKLIKKQTKEDEDKTKINNPDSEKSKVSTPLEKTAEIEKVEKNEIEEVVEVVEVVKKSEIHTEQHSMNKSQTSAKEELPLTKNSDHSANKMISEKPHKERVPKREEIEALENQSPNMQSRSGTKKSAPKVGGAHNIPSPKLAKTQKGYQDLPPLKRPSLQPTNFDSRSRQGLVTPDEGTWQRRKRKPLKSKRMDEDRTIRPSHLMIHVPISIKNLANTMKVKSSELIAVLFKQGVTLTLNDFLDDETTIQLIGQELNCEINIDTKEQDRIQVTDKSLQDEIKASPKKDLKLRPPVVTFMGHVDHGKTSLIDAIRKSNRVAYEAGSITQHIGAFQCITSHGPITVLDTPGHEAFSAMRNRGANVTDIVVLVVAGDEGIKEQTIEAIAHAKEAGVTIIVAINKSDKDGFDPEEVYRVLAEHELLTEQWGGSTVMVNCSAKTGEGIPELLELIALQSEVLELTANPSYRARGTVLESEIHKGMGNVVTLIVQNGTLNVGDSLVFDCQYAKIKTMINDLGKSLQHASPSTPVEITGISGLPEAGTEFIVVKDEKEAKTIAEMRYEDFKKNRVIPKKKTVQESFLADSHDKPKKKILPLIIRADVQGSLEALKQSLKKIKSEKVEILVINDGVGEVSESDVHLAKTSGASIIGFHTRIEGHAEELMKSINVTIKMPKIIYEALDLVKQLMIDRLDKVALEEEKGKAEIRAIFRASRIGKIAGCMVTSGVIFRSHKARLIRDGKQIWRGSISSLKREKNDVKELKKDMECGIVLDGYNDFQVGDIIETFEVTYVTQTL